MFNQSNEKHSGLTEDSADEYLLQENFLHILM